MLPTKLLLDELLVIVLAAVKSHKHPTTCITSISSHPSILQHCPWLCPGSITLRLLCRADGYEQQFATNHLGHFLLTKLLLDKVIATAKEDGTEGRIITLTSYGRE